MDFPVLMWYPLTRVQRDWGHAYEPRYTPIRKDLATFNSDPSRYHASYEHAVKTAVSPHSFVEDGSCGYTSFVAREPAPESLSLQLSHAAVRARRRTEIATHYTIVPTIPRHDLCMDMSSSAGNSVRCTGVMSDDLEKLAESHSCAKHASTSKLCASKYSESPSHNF